MGFGFPKAERDGLVASDPETFFLPGTSDLRYQWVCAHLDRLDDDEMRELVTDAWRMCTPRMLHDLPELPAPAMAACGTSSSGRTGTRCGRCCTPTSTSTTVRCPSTGATRCWTICRGTRPEAADRGRGPRRADRAVVTEEPIGWSEAWNTGYGPAMRHARASSSSSARSAPETPG